MVLRIMLVGGGVDRKGPEFTISIVQPMRRGKNCNSAEILSDYGESFASVQFGLSVHSVMNPFPYLEAYG
jgi:hypothetical protein